MIKVFTAHEPDLYEALDNVERTINSWLESFNPDTIRDLKSQTSWHEDAIGYNVIVILTITMEP